MSNTCIVASAGSGKTHTIIERAKSNLGPTLITTYTIKNTEEIKSRLQEEDAISQEHLSVMSWFGFVLAEGIRPYQSYAFRPNFIKGIRFDDFKPPRNAKKTNWLRYFTDNEGFLVKDRIADLAVALNDQSSGAVIKRIESIYKNIYIDELQDLSGSHLDFVDLLLRSSVNVVVCGDPRQSTYMASQERRNISFRGAEISRWLELRVSSGMFERHDLSNNYRSNQHICDFGDTLYPDMPATTSSQLVTESRNKHVGVFTVARDDLAKYLAQYQPQVLVWDKRAAEKLGLNGCLNFGQSKGLAFDDVLVVLPGSMENALPNVTALPPQSRAKLYVAITRARHSVGVLMSNPDRLSSWPNWSA